MTGLGIEIIYGDREIVAEGINDDYYRFFKGFRVPTSARIRASALLIELYGSYCAFRFVVEDKSCKEETLGEEVDTKDMKTSISIRCTVCLLVIGIIQNPQEESNQQAMGRFKMKLLSLILFLESIFLCFLDITTSFWDSISFLLW